MIKRIQMAATATLLIAMAVYGWAQYKPVEVGSRESESAIALARHEAAVIKKLGLTAKQKGDYDKLQAWMKAESAKLKDMTSGQVSRGMEINQALHAGLKKIFTAKQYALYMQLWEPTDLSQQDPMASGSPFGGTDEAILNTLGLSSAQWAQYRAYLQENEVKLAQFHALMKTDPIAGSKMGGELNKWTRGTMKRILTEDQYYEWVRKWDEVMSPYLANGSKHANERRSAVGGGGRPVAGRVGG